MNSSSDPFSLAGKRILVTAGGTREPIDPVRYVGNRSSGKQGVAIAASAAARGAAVTLIGANLEVSAPASVITVPVGSALELSAATLAAAAGADIVIMAAAVADFRPIQVETDKIKKSPGCGPARGAGTFGAYAFEWIQQALGVVGALGIP